MQAPAGKVRLAARHQLRPGPGRLRAVCAEQSHERNAIPSQFHSSTVNMGGGGTFFPNAALCPKQSEGSTQLEGNSTA